MEQLNLIQPVDTNYLFEDMEKPSTALEFHRKYIGEPKNDIDIKRKIYNLYSSKDHKAEVEITLDEENKAVFNVTKPGPFYHVDGLRYLIIHNGKFSNKDFHIENKIYNNRDASTLIDKKYSEIIKNNRMIIDGYIPKFDVLIFDSSLKELPEMSFIKKVENLLEKILQNIPIVTANLKDFYKIQDRYIISVAQTNHNDPLFLNLNRKTHNYYIPGFLESYSFINTIKRNYTSIEDTYFSIIDIKNWCFVNPQVIKNQLDLEIKEYKESKKIDRSKIGPLLTALEHYISLDELYDFISENEFKEKLNNYFMSKGFYKLKCSKTKIERVHQYYQIYNYNTGVGQSIDKMVKSYKCEFTYNGNHIIPFQESGWCYVTNDDNLTMIQSAWCQRTTRWSKENDGVVDQSNTWNILDWLTGPFAEKNNIIFDESPMVYKARQVKSGILKANVMKKLLNKNAEVPF